MPHKVYQLFLNQLDKCFSSFNFPKEVELTMKQPKNEIIVNFPVKLSNGEVELFKGYRIQHNDQLGPFKGGLRFHHDVHLDECKSLAAWMTLKCALQELPYGGGKGGIKFNPREYNEDDLRAISRGFSKALYPYIGENVDIPAPDVGSTAQVMDWMNAVYQSMSNNKFSSSFTGKSLENGGSKGREQATGLGVAYCVREYFKVKGESMEGKTFVVQGFGNVGSFGAKLLEGMGMKCVGVADHTGHYIVKGNFVDIFDYNKKNRSLMGISGDLVESCDRNTFFQMKCDVFLPAALELQILEEEAKIMNCRMIVEGANGPTDDVADSILEERGIDVIPDILANSGGVTTSYFEWVQNKSSHYWSEKEVLSKLEEKMVETFHRVWKCSKENKVSMRTASFFLAIDRIAKKMVSQQK